VNNVFDNLKKQIYELRIFSVLNDDDGFITEIANRFSECEKIVVIGTGGSSLGGKCLVNIASALRRENPRVMFLENIDVITFMNSLSRLNPDRTGFIVISKSGHTTETLMLFLTLIELWPNFDYRRRAISITELSENNDLRILSESLKMEIVEHDREIGGRFSVFSVVGLLPALLEGWNINEFKRGATEVIRSIIEIDSPESCSLMCEIRDMFNVFADGRVDQHVLMMYSDLLEDYGKWFAQLVGESLGKRGDFGITPVRAVGTVDQHSQLQLYLAGPANKMFTVIGVKETPIGAPRISGETGMMNDIPPTIAKLVGHEIHELMRSHMRATVEALREIGFVRVTELDRLDERSMGGLMMTNILEILGLAVLAKVNPFDQPAVERAKSRAIRLLSKLPES
jgi:glucose-6-phosphate isomerase